jgi:tripartite-type tricarboxylate transporter receptor subunit TctC
MNRRELLTLGFLVLQNAASSKAFAQSKYPDRPIRLIIPFPPGGVNDAVGRPWADKMTGLLGTVFVENVSGAGGSLGASSVARAQPDGYTILLGNTGTQVINSLASTHPHYDAIESFEPIAVLGTSAIAIVVNPAVPANTLKEFIAYAKANSGKVSYGSPGTGTTSHLTGELFKSLAGLPDLLHVPYRGAGPAIADAIGGQVAMITPNVTGQVIELHKAGKLRMLAVSSPTRLAAAPDIPTAIEAGLPDMVSINLIGLFAPARTPRDIVAQIAKATRVALSDPDLQQKYRASGFDPASDNSPEAARQLLKEQIARWTPIIRKTSLQLD